MDGSAVDGTAVLTLPTLVVLAKSPRPGLVKTRLTPDYSPHEAALLAAAALEDTLDAVAGARASHRLLLLDGPADRWQRPEFEVVPQQGAGLDERLLHAFSVAFARSAGPVLLVGMDTPQLSPELLDVDLAGADAVLGPACDGGFWALGFARTVEPAVLARCLLGVPMSQPDTGARQLRRLRSAGLSVTVLPELLDVDTANDVDVVRALAPDTCFARLATLMRPSRLAEPA